MSFIKFGKLTATHPSNALSALPLSGPRRARISTLGAAPEARGTCFLFSLLLSALRMDRATWAGLLLLPAQICH